MRRRGKGFPFPLDSFPFMQNELLSGYTLHIKKGPETGSFFIFLIIWGGVLSPYVLTRSRIIVIY